MILYDVLNILENAERIGSEKDEPEGVRYIQISDRLAKQMAQIIRETYDAFSNQMHETEVNHD